VFLNVFMWNLCKCNGLLIIEVILRNARCNSKVYWRFLLILSMFVQIFHTDILLLLMILLLTCGQILSICALITRHSVPIETTETMVIQIKDDLLCLHTSFTFYS